MKATDRRKFIEFLDSLISDNERLLLQPTQAQSQTLSARLKREIRSAKAIKIKLAEMEVLEG